MADDRTADTKPVNKIQKPHQIHFAFCDSFDMVFVLYLQLMEETHVITQAAVTLLHFLLRVTEDPDELYDMIQDRIDLKSILALQVKPCSQPHARFFDRTFFSLIPIFWNRIRFY